MSRTLRKLKDKKWTEKFHDGKIQKFGQHRSCMHHRSSGKMSLGPGGISCGCCIPVSRKNLKKAFSRWERHTAEIPDYGV
jgi:hypothetical protein